MRGHRTARRALHTDRVDDARSADVLADPVEPREPSGRSYPCPYPDCSHSNPGGSRFCARCGRQQPRHVIADEPSAVGLVILGVMWVLLFGAAALWVRRLQDLSPLIWMGAFASVIAVVGARRRRLRRAVIEELEQ